MAVKQKGFNLNQRGVALLLTMMALVFMSILVVGYLLVVTSDFQIATNYQYSEQALYVADAGVEDAIAQLRTNYSWGAGFSNKEFPAGSGNHYTVTVSNVYPVVILNSTGTAHSDYQRRIEAKITVSEIQSGGLYPVRVDYWREL